MGPVSASGIGVADQEGAVRFDPHGCERLRPVATRAVDAHNILVLEVICTDVGAVNDKHRGIDRRALFEIIKIVCLTFASKELVAVEDVVDHDALDRVAIAKLDAKLSFDLLFQCQAAGVEYRALDKLPGDAHLAFQLRRRDRGFLTVGDQVTWPRGDHLKPDIGFATYGHVNDIGTVADLQELPDREFVVPCVAGVRIDDIDAELRIETALCSADLDVGSGIGLKT